MDTVSRALERASRAAKSGEKEAKKRHALLERISAHLDQGLPARTVVVSVDESKTLRELHLLTSKPVVYIANVSEAGFADNPHVDSINEIASAEGASVVRVCAAIEADLAGMEDAEKHEFLADLGFDEPGLNRVVRAGYDLLGLQTFFTGGPKQVRAWTVRKGATAPQAAGVVHTDFERGFIRAEVVSYQDFITFGGENGAKDAGKWRLEGKDYLVQEGDVIHFRFNV
jgi:hypothetical protein